MLNKKMLNSKMALHGDKQKDLADYIGLSVQRLNAKINGTNGADFGAIEIRKIKERYNLTGEDVNQIFFADSVS